MKCATAALALLFSAQRPAPARLPLNLGVVEERGLDPLEQAAQRIDFSARAQARSAREDAP